MGEVCEAEERLMGRVQVSTSFLGSPACSPHVFSYLEAPQTQFFGEGAFMEAAYKGMID